jgi:hypothetical protein
METFPRLRTAAFDAWIADNSARGIHRAGLNGVASMIHRPSGFGLFVPSSAGLNYEIVSLPGLPPFPGTDVSPFEPRCEPMEIASADATSVTLIQKETSHSHVSAAITFRVEEPCYLHQRIELVFHRRFCPVSQKNTFHSLWASYMNAVPDRHIYVKRDLAKGGDTEGWIGLTKLDHGVADWHIRPLPGDREISVAEHLQLMKSQKPEVFSYGPLPPTDALTLGREPLPGPLTFYYGLCHDLAFIMMFKQPDAFRFAYSPCGGGKEPAWNPAWDYVLYHEDVQLNTPYTWELCLALKPYADRKDVLAEVRRYVRR